jgi:hypothetical protein
MLPLHPKVKAALIAAVVTTLVSLAAVVADVYPDSPITPLVTAFVPVVVGYLKSA